MSGRPNQSLAVLAGFDPAFSYLNVKTTGAKGNGIADDTAAIQRAVDRVAVTGGVVVVPPGVYMINPDHLNGFGVRMRSNVTLQIERGATLRAIPNALPQYAIVFCEDVENIAIEGGGTIQGDRDDHLDNIDARGMCIWFAGVRNAFVDDITVRDAWGDGFYVRNLDGQPSQDVSVTRLLAVRNRRNGMAIVSARRVDISGSTFTTTGGASPHVGLNLEPNIGQPVEDIVVRGCFAIDNENRGFQCSATGNTLLGCVAVGNARAGFQIRKVTGGVAAVTTLIGCVAIDNDDGGGSPEGGFRLQDCEGIIIESCTAHANANAGFSSFDSPGSVYRGCFSLGNPTGITVQGSPHTAIEGCTIVGDGTSLGISVNATSTGTRIANNYSEGNTNGIQCNAPEALISNNVSTKNGAAGYSVPSGANRVSIVGNRSVENDERGYDIRGSDCTILGNYALANAQGGAVRDNFYTTGSNNLWIGNTAREGALPDKPRFGLRVEGAASGNIVEDNDFRGGGSAGDVSDGVGGIAITTLDATAVLDFPSIAAGDQQELTVTVAGATAGSAVSLGPPDALEAGLAALGYVTAANTVTIRLLNVTGAPIDPASATWRVMVNKR
jgi:hypothetical protein